MIRVDLKDVLHIRDLLAHCPHQVYHVGALSRLIRNNAGRSANQAVSNLDIGDLGAEGSLEAVNEALVGLLRLLKLLLVLLVSEVAKLKIVACGIDEPLAAVLGQVAHQPLIDAVGEEQDLDSLLLEELKVRAACSGLIAVSDDVVDVLLLVLHPRDVVVEAYSLRGAVGVG